MRTFEMSAVSFRPPVTVVIEDDNLELPNNIYELRVSFEYVDGDNGESQGYREGDAIICSGRDLDKGWSATLLFLVAMCQREKMPRLVVR